MLNCTEFFFSGVICELVMMMNATIPRKTLLKIIYVDKGHFEKHVQISVSLLLSPFNDFGTDKNAF